MRHVIFWLLLVAATLLALILALPLAISECQLNDTPLEIDTCFARNAWAIRVYAVTFFCFLGFSTILYARASRWALPSLIFTAAGPFCLLLALAITFVR